MADEKMFRIQRKQDGWVSDPITQKQYEGIAGHTTDYVKLETPKPLVVVDPDAATRSSGTAEAAPARTTRTAPRAHSRTAKAPAPTPAPADAPADSTTSPTASGS